MSLRSDLIEYLAALIEGDPALGRIHLVGSARSVDAPSRPNLIVKTNGFRKLPQAPQRNLTGEFTLTLVSKHLDIDLAENELEALLEVLLPKLFTWGLSWETADQVGWGDTQLAYDITVNSIFKKE